METRNDRVYAWAVVVAALIIRPDRKVFFVKRKGKNFLTFPTEGINLDEVRDISLATFRGAKEEIFKKFDGLPLDSVKEILTISVRPNEEAPERSNLIVVFVFEVDKETADIMSYEEEEETLFVWIEPSLALFLPWIEPFEGIPNMPLDELAEDGLVRYLEKHPLIEEKKEEGFNGIKIIEKRQKTRLLLQMLRLVFKKSSP